MEVPGSGSLRPELSSVLPIVIEALNLSSLVNVRLVNKACRDAADRIDRVVSSKGLIYKRTHGIKKVHLQAPIDRDSAKPLASTLRSPERCTWLLGLEELKLSCRFSFSAGFCSDSVNRALLILGPSIPNITTLDARDAHGFSETAALAALNCFPKLKTLKIPGFHFRGNPLGTLATLSYANHQCLSSLQLPLNLRDHECIYNLGNLVHLPSLRHLYIDTVAHSTLSRSSVSPDHTAKVLEALGQLTTLQHLELHGLMLEHYGYMPELACLTSLTELKVSPCMQPCCTFHSTWQCS